MLLDNSTAENWHGHLKRQNRPPGVMCQELPLH
jgi:hypothetical protein